ncbi:MAG: acylphosphatase [bacterium]
MKRYKVYVIGDVQGVFYRHNAKKQANELGIMGWCRNESDGSVYVVVEGEDKSIQKFFKWLKLGSPLSTVEKVDTFQEKYTGLEKDFEIR